MSGAAAGLHLVLHLPATASPAAVVSAAAARSVRVTDLAAYHTTSEHAAPAAIREAR